LENIDRQTYLGYLEQDYYERAKAEHGDELGLFGRIDAPKWMEAAPGLEGDNYADKLDNFLSNRISGYLEDDEIIQSIDSDIKKLTDGNRNETSKTKNFK